MRIGSYNVESLFSRPAAFVDGKSDILRAYADLGAILIQPAYSATDKADIIALLKSLGLGKSDDAKYARLRQDKGRLLKRASGTTGAIQSVVAAGRDSWVGGIELERVTPKAAAIKNTARVIADVDADILGVIEVENRPTLKAFAVTALKKAGVDYPHAMVIDGNDNRGIDVGLLAKDGYEIAEMRSHVDDVANGSTIFSRDCAEYEVTTPTGATVVVMVNHLKSKLPPVKDSNATRLAQADRVKEIYEARRAEGYDNIAIVGDLNDTPDSAPLAPLLTGTDLADITTHQTFVADSRIGTFGNATKSDKIDYVLLSPALFAKVTGGRIFRMGVWGGKNGTLFTHYDTIKVKTDQASDHAAIYADINI